MLGFDVVGLVGAHPDGFGRIDFAGRGRVFGLIFGFRSKTGIVGFGLFFGLGLILSSGLFISFYVAVVAFFFEPAADFTPNAASLSFFFLALLLWKLVASILGLAEPAPVLMSLAGSLSPASPSWPFWLSTSAFVCVLGGMFSSREDQGQGFREVAKRDMGLQ